MFSRDKARAIVFSLISPLSVDTNTSISVTDVRHKHLYSLFWSVKEITTGFNEKTKNIYKDGKLEGEQLGWYSNGQLQYQHFYKDGKLDGEQLKWF